MIDFCSQLETEKLLQPGLSDEDVWKDLAPVLRDHTALMVTGNSPETAYRLVVKSWREAMFLKYSYTEVCIISMEIDWKIFKKISFYQSGKNMELRFSENPRADPLAITGTSANDSEDEEAPIPVAADPGKFDAYFGGPGPGTAVLVLPKNDWNLLGI